MLQSHDHGLAEKIHDIYDAESVTFFENTTEIWRDLRDRFSYGDKFCVADLQEEINATKQGDSSITKYYTHLKILWKELEMFQIVLTCSCSATFLWHSSKNRQGTR